jgi:hypothetical protein
MKKILATISLLIVFFSSEAQSPLYINKYLKDSLVAGVWNLWHDSLHNGSFRLIGSGGGGGGAGTVTSVTGTSNRITVATGTTTPVIDISAAYVGQTSITTLGTIGTGVWNGTNIGYSKLTLTGSIVNADVNASAAIAYSKLNLNNSIVAGDLTSNSVTTSKILDANVTIAKLSATGTPSATTVLAGDNTWKTAVQYTFTSPANGDWITVLSGGLVNTTPDIGPYISEGSNISFAGDGTAASPIVISATGGAAGVADSIRVLSATPATGNIWIDSATGILKTRDWVNSYIKSYYAGDSVSFGGAGNLPLQSDMDAPNGTSLSAYTPEQGPGWTLINGGGWEINSNAVSNATPTASGNNWVAIVDAGTLDYNITFAMFKTGTGGGQAIVRYTDASNYVAVNFNSATNTEIFNVVAGVATSFATLTFVTNGVSHNIEVQVLGSNVEVFSDGVSLGSGTIPTPQTGTSVGIGTFASGSTSIVFFDTFLAVAP